MRIRRLLLTVIGGAGVLAVAAAAGLAAPGAVSSGSAIEVPGTAALNSGVHARVNSVSCASVGNCSAGGYYTDTLFRVRPFVVNEKNGVWGTAIRVPGTVLSASDTAFVLSVSCARAGNCAAGGVYTDSSPHGQAFVVDEKKGVWGKAIAVPGLAALNTGGWALLNSISCPKAGNCAAGGFYGDRGTPWYSGQAFVVSEKRGVWGKAIEVPGTAALNTGDDATVNSVSCSSVGNCSAGGSYSDSYPSSLAFVVTEKNGVWGNAIEVAGTAPAPGISGNARVNSVSCAGVGYCVAGGLYRDADGWQQAFVVSESNGIWGGATIARGTAALNTHGNAQVSSVSCTSAGNCAIGGSYLDSSAYQAFVLSETNGVWSTAIEVPGIAALNTTGVAQLNSISCSSAGNCAAGGYYNGRVGFPPTTQQAFLVSETNGVWGQAAEVPGTDALNTGGDAQVKSVSCAGAGNCAVGGYYRVDPFGSGVYQAFVTAP